ncbi:MAG: single-stranded-DNA-specific exonuclease RecJ [Thiotrichaceae bacterium]|nr:single-stranded-DNA-specific exonuclease RecJ [Thiotrichaceae bacterium]
MYKVIQRRPLADTSQFPENLHPVVKRVLAARHSVPAQTIDYSLQNLFPYHSLRNIEAAVALLYEALHERYRILIVADYDVDGATSCAVAVKALSRLGAHQVDFLVPNREKHGYGLTPEIIKLAQDYQPQLLITVDNGISSVEGVAAAQRAGIKVLITDHHAPPLVLPKAEAIVNPNQRGDEFPSKNLAGVGVIFYVMSALRAKLRAENWFTQQQIPEPNLANLLDLVALGTVADVVPLDYNNRILVEQGLRRIRAQQGCQGINALLNVAKRQAEQIVASDLSFALAPRLNAAGRMDDMRYGIDCLLSEDAETALEYAKILQNFNEERQFVEAEMQQEALAMLERLQLDTTQDLAVGLCLYDPNWHQGVIGILSSRIKERVHRPVLVFTRAQPGFLRASGRSVKGVHLRDVIESIAIEHPNMIPQFGGHAMAAGLTLVESAFPEFQQLFDHAVRQQLSADQLYGTVYSDGELQPQEFSVSLAEQLRGVSPWGQGFPEPVFDGQFDVIEHLILKEKHLKMKLRPLGGQEPIDAILFNYAQHFTPPATLKRVQLAYKLEINYFRGSKNLQLMTEYCEALA